jgi:competence ComEA-like helix-hairpin-helix protein
MRGFTRSEQRAILFLLVTFGIGSAVVWYRRSLPPPAVEQALLDSLQVHTARAAPDTQHVAVRDTLVARVKKSAGPINLNTATFAELVGLPGVGEVLAKRILDYRAQHGKFARVEELEKVKGIGKSKVRALKAHLIVR